MLVHDRPDIVKPSLNIYGTSTLESFLDALTSGDVASGSLNRWLVFEGDETATMEITTFERVVADKVPEQLIKWHCHVNSVARFREVG